MGSPGPYCQTCRHDSRAAIDRALVEGTPAAEVARLYGLPPRSVQRHAKDHLPETLTKAAAAKEAARADDLLSRLEQVVVRINKLFDACDSWLTDPLNPDLYDIGPRAGEIMVTYEEELGERTVRRKKPLSQLIGDVEASGYDVVSWEAKHADPRELILKTTHRLQGYLDLVGRVTDQLQNQEGDTTVIKVYVGLDPNDV